MSIRSDLDPFNHQNVSTHLPSIDLGSGNQIEFTDPTEQVARFHLRILKMKGGGPFVLKIHEISTAKVVYTDNRRGSIS